MLTSSMFSVKPGYRAMVFVSLLSMLISSQEKHQIRTWDIILARAATYRSISKRPMFVSRSKVFESCAFIFSNNTTQVTKKKYSDINKAWAVGSTEKEHTRNDFDYVDGKGKILNAVKNILLSGESVLEGYTSADSYDVFCEDFSEEKPVSIALREKSKDLLALVRHLRAGDIKNNIFCSLSTSDSTSHKLRSPVRQNFLPTLDQMAKSFSLGMVGIATLRTMGRIVSHDDYRLVNEVASKVLSAETALAIKTIREILARFDDHGVVDVFAQYPAKDVITAVMALSRLQRASIMVDERDSKEVDTEDRVFDVELLGDLAHYAVFANAAYGWKGGLALSGRLHLGDMNTLIARTGINEEDIVAAQWRSKTHRPAHFIVRDTAKKKLVLCIRGTLSAKDVLTDLCCTAENFSGTNDEKGFNNKFQSNYEARAHHGMLEGARGVAETAHETIAVELAANPDFQLVIVGHSLGGGTAAVLGTMWQGIFPNLSVYAYGCPCVGPIDANPTLNEAIISVVGEGDPFSNLSLGHLADISAAISQLCVDDVLRKEVLQRTKGGKLEDMSEEDLHWCYHEMERLRESMTEEKFYPPGKILYMGGAGFGNGDVTLREVPTNKFRDLTLHPNMFDLLKHAPNHYESALRRFWNDINNEVID